MPGTALSPFAREHRPTTVLLDSPPLARVLVQVRFAPVLAVANEAFVGPFQQQLADRYPIGSADMEFAVNLPAPNEAPPSATETRIWRFETVDATSRVTLAPAFVAFETERYDGNEKFFTDLQLVLDAVADHIKPQQVQRLGVRYFQRLTDGADMDRITDLFRQELLGVCAAPEARDSLELCLTTARHADDGVTLMARWGMLPPNLSPDIVPAVDVSSWVFDIDVFDETRAPFDPVELAERAIDFSRRQYQFFRWAVEPAFLERFGANREQLAEIEAMMSA